MINLLSFIVYLIIGTLVITLIKTIWQEITNN
jgi:predicted membrane channel-forming protein YqfA (hemolysin III family)